MSTLALAKKKYARKMRNAGSKWKRAVTGKGPAYREGLARFFGVSPESIDETRVSAYTAGVEAVSAEDFQAAVSGKEEKWAKRMKEAFVKGV